MTEHGRGRCGDIALGFGKAVPTRSRSPHPWSLELEVGPARLWTCEPSESWRGFPLRIDRDDRGVAVVVGDTRDHWLRIDHESASGHWRVTTDRFGTLQAYRRVRGDPLICTFSPALWGDDPTLDWVAIAGFFTLGWYPGDRMPVDGVRILRPATEYRYDGQGASPSSRRWWTWRHQPDCDAGRDPATEVGDALATILDERTVETGRIGLPVSGGLDSRSTLAALTRPDGPVARSQLRTFSYGYEPSSVELSIASELTARRGLPIKTEVVQPYLFDDLDVVLGATEGLVDLATCRQACVRSFLRDETEAVVAAHWGDVWFGMSTPPAETPLAEWLLAGSTRRGHRWLLDHVVRDRVDDPMGALGAILAAESEAVPMIEDRAVAATALKTEQWSFRSTEASLRMHQAASDPILPYYDERMADLVLSLPGALLGGRQLQIEHLRRTAPDLAAVTWEAYETDLFALRRRRTTGLPRRVVRSLYRRARPPGTVLENWEIQFGGQELERWRRWLQRSGGCGSHVTDRAALDSLVDRVAARDRDAGHALSRLVTFCAWRERYT